MADPKQDQSENRCADNDPLCPCQDGDMCHYRGPNAWPVTTPLAESWTAQWDDNGYWYIEPLGITGSGLRGDSGDCLERSRAMLIAQAPRMRGIVTRYMALVGNTGYSITRKSAREVYEEAAAVLAAARGEQG